jgi:protein disulfide-isomerase
MVSRDGKPTYYPPMTPFEMRDVKKVLTWMKSVWLPIVPEMTSSNAREIMDGKLVVLGILSRDRSDEFILSKRELKSAALEWIDKQDTAYQLERQELRDAKQLRIEEADDKDNQRALRDAKSIRINMDEIERTQVGFAWVDGVFWERWIRTTYGIDVKDGEAVVINDEDVSPSISTPTYTLHTNATDRTTATGIPPFRANQSASPALPSSKPSRW